MACKIAVLDFDGVILESADIKTRAFRALFARHPEHVDAIVDHHLRNAGISRYEKFRHILGNILGQSVTDARLAALGSRFSELVTAEIEKAPFVPGALEFVKGYSRKMRLYVASGTPEDELLAIVTGKGLRPYFRGVYGSPATKPQILSEILAAESASCFEAVFVGGARTDYEAAKAVGVPFVGRASRGSHENPFRDLAIPVLPDLSGLGSLVSP